MQTGPKAPQRSSLADRGHSPRASGGEGGGSLYRPPPVAALCGDELRKEVLSLGDYVMVFSVGAGAWCDAQVVAFPEGDLVQVRYEVDCEWCRKTLPLHDQHLAVPEALAQQRGLIQRESPKGKRQGQEPSSGQVGVRRRLRTLKGFFLDEYRRGLRFQGGSKYSFEHDEGIAVYVHHATGVRVWANALDLRATSHGDARQPALVFFHYTNEVTFRCITDPASKDAELWASLKSRGESVTKQPDSGLGEGVHASQMEPDDWNGKDEILLKIGLVDYCIPIIAPSSLAMRQMNTASGPEKDLKTEPFDQGLWLLAAGNEAGAVKNLAANSVELYQKQLEGAVARHGEQHPETLTSYNNLASCLQAQGRTSEAEPLHRKALEGCVVRFGQRHPETLASHNNLAHCLQALGRASEAELLHREALEGCEAKFGEQHPHTLISLTNLADCLQAQGRAPEAEPLRRKALEGRVATLGEQHPHTLSSYSNLATCLQAQGHASEAEPLHQKALEGSVASLGEQHPHTLISYNNLAHCLQLLGRAQDAEPLHRKAFEGCVHTLGEQHPHTLTYCSNLATCLQAQGRESEAETLHRKSLEGSMARLGEQHPHTLISYGNLADCLQAQVEPLRRKTL